MCSRASGARGPRWPNAVAMLELHARKWSGSGRGRVSATALPRSFEPGDSPCLEGGAPAHCTLVYITWPFV